MVFLCRLMGTFRRSLGVRGPFSKSSRLCDKKRYCQAATEQLTGTFTPFMEMLQNRRMEASRSVLVQVQSAQSYKQLFTYCESMGKVKCMFHYTEGPEPMHFIIVEFESESDVANVLRSSSHIQENHSVPVASQFLWFRAASKKFGTLKASAQAKLTLENGTDVRNENDLKAALLRCNTVSEQIEQLHSLTKLNDVGHRLRFLTAKQVETTISGMFPRICAFPFGSSVNGFGKMGCDLDIVLRLTQDRENDNSRLIYHCKAASGSERSTNQRNMETIGDLIHLFLPGCNQVRRILQARVPIIKYYQHLTNVECDLSMSNMTGIYMSDFLYMMGEIDPRVRPLVFAIRKWAKEVNLTNSSPGRWITNFSLTLLVLAFLQKPLQSPPILPTLNRLAKLAGPNDYYVTEDGIDCTFLRDITKLKFQTQNTSSLEVLLREFFEYYAQFDFGAKAICLNEAVAISKPEHSPLYIVNPIEKGLNVSKNVSIEEVEKFKIEVRNAAWILESKERNYESTGLIAILDSKDHIKNKLPFVLSAKNNRLMEISELFDEEERNSDPNVEYKNDEVKKQVRAIKKKTTETIKSLQFKHTRQKRR
ncbi:poly(A) RNA polymerase, mitochondrial [Dendroctonus ponderosae]|uniref:Poly(A) RNA polymerase, mitochondrial n=1 Tax=Dendroctonus ponderosae TaxID=77166 RepID=U4UI64_DENPD|nr:poly(A) RNA polymerase, mitochondrial [Dendroctonus ponderosae]ERL89575.1 hypothetical protein D910_06940 [Dendroctonus ponderosae]